MVEYKKKKIILQSGGTRNFYYKISYNGKKKQVSKREYLEKKGGHKNNPYNNNWEAPPEVTMNNFNKLGQEKKQNQLNHNPQEKERLNGIKVNSQEESNFLRSYNPSNKYHVTTKNRLSNEARKAKSDLNVSHYQKYSLNRKYGNNPDEYQRYLDTPKSKPLTKQEANNRENEEKRKELQKKKNKEENMKKREESIKIDMNNGEKHRTNVYNPTRRSLVQKLGISETALDFPTIFIPIFRDYISFHNKNSNINTKIKEMVEYTEIWRKQKEYDNLESGVDIPYMFMKLIWDFQKNYEKNESFIFP
jgi:hypothetical protein